MAEPEWGRFEPWRERQEPFAERLATARARKAAARLDLSPEDADDLRLDIAQTIYTRLFTILDEQPDATESYCRTAMCWAADHFVNREFLDAPLDGGGIAVESRTEEYID